MNIARQTLTAFFDDDCMRMAASLAYYTIFSLPPLLILVVTIVGLAVEPQQAEVWLQEQVGSANDAGTATQIQTMIERASERVAGGFSLDLIFSLVGVLVGATAAFGELQYALNTTWGIRADPQEGAVWGYLTKRVLSLGMILVIGFLMLVALILSAVIAAVQGHIGPFLSSLGMGVVSKELVWVIDSVVSLIVITQLLAAIFKVLPDAKIKWRDVEFGAFITALLFVVGKFLIGIYIGQSDFGEVYGAAATLAVLLIWVYYSSLILLMGAEFTQVWTRRRGRAIRPTEGAVRHRDASPTPSRKK